MVFFEKVAVASLLGVAVATGCQDAPIAVTVRGDDNWSAQGCSNLFHSSELAGCGSPGMPCVTLVAGDQVACDSCFLITYRQGQAEDAACNGGVCPKRERTLLARAATVSADGAEGMQVTMSYKGWEMLCPLVCASESGEPTTICVESENTCEFGVVKSFRNSAGVVAPGSASVPFNLSGISWQEADCRSGLHKHQGCRGGEKYVGIPPTRS